mmetsp:Transcript_8354/g.12180  ORF Transcript_8354/g.12180 Transcript_8354/m.12180 type:complete len:407 (+) Transcript_8354:137-1357(+)
MGIVDRRRGMTAGQYSLPANERNTSNSLGLKGNKTTPKTVSFFRQGVCFGIAVVVTTGIWFAVTMANVNRRVTSKKSNKQGIPLAHNKANLAAIDSSAPQCSQTQMQAILNQLPTNEFCFSLPWRNQCPITLATKCPENGWLQSYYENFVFSGNGMKSFIALNVGCNKGTDAVKMLRMIDRSVNLDSWRNALKAAAAPHTITPEVCSDDDSPPSSSMVESTPSIVTAQVHCIEPLPITTEVLQKATSLTNYASKGLQIHGTAISSENGTVYFPKPTHQREDLRDFEKVEVGTENKGIGSCAQMEEQEKQKHCVPVSVTTLDSFSEKQLPEDSIINYILTDVEGYDFDVLLGAQNTLRRTEYLEFEFNWKERWALPDRSLTKTIEFLDNLDFTCYWAGINKLWRITN